MSPRNHLLPKYSTYLITLLSGAFCLSASLTLLAKSSIFFRAEIWCRYIISKFLSGNSVAEYTLGHGWHTKKTYHSFLVAVINFGPNKLDKMSQNFFAYTAWWWSFLQTNDTLYNLVHRKITSKFSKSWWPRFFSPYHGALMIAKNSDRRKFTQTSSFIIRKSSSYTTFICGPINYNFWAIWLRITLKLILQQWMLISVGVLKVKYCKKQHFTTKTVGKSSCLWKLPVFLASTTRLHNHSIHLKKKYLLVKRCSFPDSMMSAEVFWTAETLVKLELFTKLCCF